MERLLHRKERIILTAIEIIDELGIQGLSSREIAKRQDISEGTLFRHFKNKNEIILEVFDYFSKFDTDIMETVKVKKLNCKESIILWVKLFAEYYENYPAITSISNLYNSLIDQEQLSQKAKDIFNDRFNFVKYIIIEGQKNGEISEKIDSEDLADIIMGLRMETISKWRMNNHNFSLKDKILATLKIVLDVI